MKFAGKIFKGTIKIVAYTVAGLLLLFAVAWGAIQMPATQKYLVDYATKYLNTKLQTKVAVQRVNIEFFRTIVLEDIFVADKNADTLLYAHKFRIKLNNFSLLHKQVHTRELGLEKAVIHFHRSANSKNFNYNFLLDAFASKDTASTTTPQDTVAFAWQVDLHKIRLQHVRMHWLDDRDKMYLQAELKEFSTDFETLGLEDKHPVINQLYFDQLKWAFHQAPHQKNSHQEQEAESEKKPATNALKPAKTANKVTRVKSEANKKQLNPSGYRLTLKSLIFKKCDFRYDNDAVNKTPTGIDYDHLLVNDFSTSVKNINIGANDIAFHIKQLAFAEKSGFNLQQLAIKVQVNYPQVLVEADKVQTSNSVVHHGFKLDIASVENLEPSIKTAFLKVHFENDSLGLKDISFFTGGLSPLLQKQTIKLDGRIDVDQNKLQLKDLGIAFNKENLLKTSLMVDNFTDYPKAFYDLNLQTLQVQPVFVQRLIPQPLPAQMMLTPTIKTSLDLKGYLKDLKGKWQLMTSVGKLESDFKAQTDEKFKYNNIQAKVKATMIQVGALTKVPEVGGLSFDSYIEARQSPEKTEVDTLSLLVHHFEYKKYTYQGLKVMGKFVNKVAESTITYKDEQANLELQNVVDLKAKDPHVFLLGNVYNLNLHKLNLFEDSLNIRTKIIGEIKGFDIDSLTGYLGIAQTRVDYLGKKLKLDSLNLAVSQKDSIRHIDLKSDILSAKIKGQFYIDELPQAFEGFIKNYYTNFSVDSVGLKRTRELTIKATMHKNPELLYAFVPDLKIPVGVGIDLRFKPRQKVLITQINAPLLSFAGEKIHNLYFNVRGRPTTLRAFVTCTKIETKENIDISTPSFRTTIRKNKASFSIKLDSDSLKSQVKLFGYVKARTDTFDLHFSSSHIIIEKQEWNFRENCKVIFSPAHQYLFIDSVALTQGKQQLLLRSRINRQKKILQEFKIINFDIASVPEMLGVQPYKLRGIVNGNVRVSNVFNVEHITSAVRVKKLKALDIDIGDLRVEVSEKGLKGLVNMKMVLQGKSNRMRANGTYDIFKDSLYIFAGVSNIRLEQFTPLVSDYIKKMHGRMNARLRLTGSITQPAITGDLKFKGKSAVQVKMLGEPHFIDNQSIYFEGDWISFKDFTITDINGRTNVINGKIHNLGYNAFFTNLGMVGDNFQLMKSTAYDFKTLHGTIYSDYDIKVTGLLDDLNVKAEATLKPGSNVYTSIDDDEATHIKQSRYIEFTSPENDSLAKQDSTKLSVNTHLNGFTVNSVIKVSPEARLNIIIDESTNDRLVCSGSTELSVDMDNTGELEISGDYIIETGKYTMNLFEVVHKEIEVKKGSSVHFFGDPMQGVMNITTIYETKTSTYSLLLDHISSDQTSEVEQAKQIIPVQVLIHLRGQFLNPQISFDIVIPKDKVRNPSTLLMSKLNEIRNNQNELYKQVFGLIVLGHFITADEALGSNGVDVTYQLGSGLSGFLTDQLNKLSDSYLGGVQINLDLNNKNDFAKDRELAVHLSKKFFQDRLRVSVGSYVNLDNHDNNEQNTHQNLIGDITVEYRLNRSGNLNLKFFRKTNNTNNLNTSNLTQNTNQINGFSISYHKSFSRLGDIFRRRRVENPKPVNIQDKKGKKEPEKKTKKAKVDIQKQDKPKKD